MSPQEFPNIQDIDTNTNLSDDLSTFSQKEKIEIINLQKQLINQKIEHLHQNQITKQGQEMLYAGLGSKLLLHEQIDPKLRQMTNKTDKELIVSLIKKVYGLLGVSTDRTPQNSKKIGFWGNSALAVEIQKYIGTNPDGKFGPDTKKAIKNFLAEQVPTSESTLLTPNGNLQISPENAEYLRTSVTSAMTKYTHFLQQNSKKIGDGTSNFSDGALCTTYTQMMLGTMINTWGYTLPVRNLGSTWNIDRMTKVASIAPYIHREVLIPSISAANLKQKLLQAPAGSLLTLQYDRSHYKKEGIRGAKEGLDSPTHTLISLGNGQFSHWINGKRLDATVAEMKISENGKIVISGMSLTIIQPNEKYCCGLYSPNISKLKKRPPFEEHNTEKMSGIAFAQDIADTYNVSKELVVHQLYSKGYNLGKIYPIGEISFSLAVKPQIIYTSEHTTNNIEIIKKLPIHVREAGKASRELNTSLNLGISDEHMSILLTILENETGQGTSRTKIKSEYHNLYPVFRKAVDLIRKPDSFGPFQVNKNVITPILSQAIKNKNSDFINKIGLVVQKEPQLKSAWSTLLQKLHILNQDITNGSVNTRDINTYMEKNFGRYLEELLLKSTGFGLLSAHEIMKQNREILITQSASLKTGEVNVDNLNLTTVFAQNAGLPRTYKGLAQFNLLQLSESLGIKILPKVIPSSKPFFIDGIWQDESLMLLNTVRKLLGQKPEFLIYNKSSETISINNKTYKLASPGDMKQFFTTLSFLAQKRGVNWEAKFEFDLAQILARKKEKNVHLHYAYVWLDKTIPRQIPLVYKRHISQK